MRTITISDYPEKWPQLKDDLYTALTSQDETAINVGLLIFQAICENYSFAYPDDINLNEICNRLMPPIGILID